jgi:hypothetical protein
MFTVLFSIAMPINAQEILIEIINLINLNVIDTKPLLEKFMVLEELPPFNLLF